ncbi:hypothetical protein ACIBQ6_15095 [Nonomuraea sp. NPDC049655]|uniref:phosphotransferase-like protein n=1 Tax=Nonomuraea sp. NPDC049655 TaxID=3364355 RepID=UPI0037B4657E
MACHRRRRLDGRGDARVHDDVRGRNQHSLRRRGERRAGVSGGAGGLAGLDVLWVGVRCDGAVAAERERARGDRVPGMAEAQAAVVHDGVPYGLEVDTASTASLTCAETIATCITQRGHPVPTKWSGASSASSEQARDSSPSRKGSPETEFHSRPPRIRPEIGT